MRKETLTSFERDARRMVDELGVEKTALIVREDGTPAAYLVDPKTYQLAAERLAMLEIVAIGEKDFDEGRVVTHEQAKAKLAKWLK